MDGLKQKFERGGSLLPVFEQMNKAYAKGGGAGGYLMCCL